MTRVAFARINSFCRLCECMLNVFLYFTTIRWAIDRYLAIKFQEMEEKMRQEKNRNRVKDDDDNDEEDEENADDDTESAVPENTTIEMSNEYEVDDEDQRHNIDNFMQQGPSPGFNEDIDNSNQFG